MTNITSYLNSQTNQYNYQKTTQQWVADASGASGASGVSGASGTGHYEKVWVADHSGASGASGAGHYETKITVLENVSMLSLDEVIDLFTTGSLMVSEIEKWLNEIGRAHV